MWVHKEPRTELSFGFSSAENCQFCSVPLREFRYDLTGSAGRPDNIVLEAWQAVRICPDCGWWTVLREENAFVERLGGGQCVIVFGATGGLRNFDLADITTPIQEVRSFLVRQFGARFEVHPRLFEETVASVFRDLGFEAVATAYSGDGGVDVILRDSDGQEIGVQVKRWRNSVQVEQIRALTGALVLGGYTRGMFVTTSSFQRGARDVVDTAATKGYPIELIDAHRFFDALRLANQQRLDRAPHGLIPNSTVLRVLQYQGLSCNWDGPVVTFGVENNSQVDLQDYQDVLGEERTLEILADHGHVG
jgi:restriction system protein